MNHHHQSISYKLFFTVLAASIILFSLFSFLFSAPLARAAAGSGTVTVNANTAGGVPAVIASSTSNWFEFTFTATESMNTGEVDIFVPSGWTQPQASLSTDAAYSQMGTSTASGGASSHLILAVQAVSADGNVMREQHQRIGTTDVTATEDDNDTCNTTPYTTSGDTITSSMFSTSTTESGVGTPHIEGDHSWFCSNDNNNGSDLSDTISWDYGVAADWSPYTTMGFWGYFSERNSGSVLFGWDDNANLPIANGSFTSTLGNAHTWTFATGTDGNRTSVVAFGFWSLSQHFDNGIFYADEVLLGGTTTPTIVATSTGYDLHTRLMGMATNHSFTFSYGTSSGLVTAPEAPGQYRFITSTRQSSDQSTTSLAQASQPVVYVQGKLVLGEHGVGSQIEDALTNGTATTSAPLLRFRIDPWAETASTTLTIDFTNTGGIVAGDFANTAIYVDADNNGKYDSADATAAFGTPTISGTTMVFSATTTIAARTNYFLVSDINNLASNDTTTISLVASNVVAFGADSQTYRNSIGGMLNVTGTVTDATHTNGVLAGADLQQIDYRWRNDTVSESTNEAWLAAENATSTTDRGGVTRLRIEVSNEGAATSDKTRFKLQSGIARNAGNGLGCVPVTQWMPVGEAGSTTPDWAMAPSNFLSDAASTTDFSGSLTNENTTFLGGSQKDQDNQTIYAELTTANFIEHEFSLTTASSSIAIGMTFCFRLIDGTTGATQNFTYVRYPATTITRQASVPGGVLEGEETPSFHPRVGGTQQGGGEGSGESGGTPPGTPSGGGQQQGGGEGSGESGFIPFLKGTLFALLPFFLRRWW